MAVEPFDFPVVGADRQAEPQTPVPEVAPVVTAFVGRTERGPLNEPVAVRSFEQYRRRFGSYCAFSHLPHCVEQYFAHGGYTALIVRIANRAARARIEIPAGDQRLCLMARQPGSREYLRVSIDYDRVEHDPHRFNLVVQRLDRPDSELVQDQELYGALSVDPADDRHIVDALQDSDLVRLNGPVPSVRPEATRANRPGQPIPYLSVTVPGTDGEGITDYDVIGSNRNGTGLFALDRAERVDFLCVPPPPGHSLGATSYVAAERYCERRKSMLIWDPPEQWTSVAAAIAGVRAGSPGSRNALTCYPRIDIRGHERGGHRSSLPPSGAIAGLLAAAARRGHWGPLTGDLARLCAGLVPSDRVSERDAQLLNRYGINVLTRGPDAVGIFCGNVTMAGPNLIGRLWQRLDRRRVALLVVGSVERSTRWAVGAVSDSELGGALQRQLNAFLGALHGAGALAGGRADQAYFVRIDPAFRGALPLTIRVGIALDRPGEFVVYEICHDTRSSSTRALPGLEVRELTG